MRGVIRVAILVALFVPSISAAQTYVSPGVAAAEALERYQLCRDIQRAGGRCPDESVPIADVRAYYNRLVDANWAAFRAEQQRLIEQTQLEQRITNTLTAALQLQEAQFRQMLDAQRSKNADDLAAVVASFTNALGEMSSEIEKLRADIPNAAAPAPTTRLQSRGAASTTGRADASAAASPQLVSVGSSVADVVRLQSQPDKRTTTPSDDMFFYGDAWVMFGRDGKVVSWYDPKKTLKVARP